MTILSILFLYFLLISQAFQFIFCHSAENTTCFMVCSMLTSSESFSVFLLSFFFLGPHPQHMEVPRLRVGAVATILYHRHATPHLSCVCNLHHSSQQCRILNPLRKARGQICVLMDTSQISAEPQRKLFSFKGHSLLD